MRAYYGLDVDINSKLKMIGELFYDPYFLELWQQFEYEDNWSIFRFDSLLDFSLIGVLDGVIKPLSEKNISVFVLTTFDTDYVMFKTENKFKVI